MAVRYIDNTDGSFTLIREDPDGTVARSTFLDPDGSYRAELDRMAASGDIGAPPGRGPGFVPETNAPYRPPSPELQIPDGGFAPMGETPPGLAGSPVVDPSAITEPQQPAGTLLRLPGSPGQSSTTATAPQSSTTRSESRSVKDPDGTIAERQGEAIDAQRTANEEMGAGKREALGNTAELLSQEQARAEVELRAQNQIASQQEAAVSAALADRKAKRAIPIDPSLAFGDDAGAYAVMAEIGKALANVGAAWMGGAQQPINVIDRLIERSIAIQREQKQQGIDEATESVELGRAQLAESRANARVAIGQILSAQRAQVANENELSMLDGLMAENEARLKRDEAEYAQAIADEVTINQSTTSTSGGQSTTTTSGTPDQVIEIPAGSDEEEAGDAVNAALFDQGASEGDKKQLQKLSENVMYTNDRAGVVAELERLESKHGAVSDVVGLWQNTGLSSLPPAQAFLRMTGTSGYVRTPEQNRAADLLAKLESLNRFQWKTEPNSSRTQERLALIGLPKSDSDIPTFFAKQKEGVAEMRNREYLGYDDKVVGKFRTMHRKVKPSDDIEAF